MSLMTDEAVETEQFTQFQGGTVVNRLHIGQGPLGLQMALSAMSFVDNVKDVEHVANNVTNARRNQYRILLPDLIEEVTFVFTLGERSKRVVVA